MFDFVRYIKFCFEGLSQQIPIVLIYYSHIPVIVLGIIFSVFVILKNRKDIIASFFFVLNFIFILWVVGDLITWVIPYNSSLAMFSWSTLELTEVLFFFISFNFAYYFFFNKNVSYKLNLLFLVPIIPVAYFTFTGQILENYNIIVCEATEKASVINGFVLFTDIFYILLIIISYIISVVKNKKKDLSKNSFFFGGLMFFLTFYLLTLYISDYVEDYNWSLIALAGMPVFLAVMAFSLVRFRIFNIKMLGTQILVFLSIFMVAIQFIFIRNPINIILNSVTLVVLIIGGVLLVKSVKKVDEQREALDLANKQQTNLLHFISHQVKGFFTKSRNAFSGLLEGDYGPIPDTARHIIQEGFDSDNRGVQTVQEILSAANLKTGQTTYIMNDTNLINVIKDILLLLKPASDKKSLTVNFNPGVTNLMMKLDTAQITQALKNLIDNSIKYTPSGKIDITLEVQENNLNVSKNNNKNVQATKKVVIKVSDTGVGISPEDMPKLFSEGGRGKESIKVNVDSTGYGLYIVKNIIEAHGGSVTAYSGGEGKGSVFTVVLPVK